MHRYSLYILWVRVCIVPAAFRVQSCSRELGKVRCRETCECRLDPRLVKGPLAPVRGPRVVHTPYGVQVKPGRATSRPRLPPSDPCHTPMYP